MKKKKLLASFLLVFVLALPFVAQAATSYSYYSFKYILTSKNYSFSSGSVSLETYNKEVSNSRSGLSDTFSITLYDSKGKVKVLELRIFTLLKSLHGHLTQKVHTSLDG
ncbi:hypothetical protein F3K44_02495 [Bacillus megaterium]|nr:hypothetical protein [Priestia megaterium]